MKPLLSSNDLAVAMEMISEGCRMTYIAHAYGITDGQLSNALREARKYGIQKKRNNSILAIICNIA